MSDKTIAADLKDEYEELTTCALRDSARHYADRNASLIERTSAAEAERDALRKAAEWTPITPENLPKVGDEILTIRKATGKIRFLAQAGDDWVEGMMLTEASPNIEYFRPINPPSAALKEEPHA